MSIVAVADLPSYCLDAGGNLIVEKTMLHMGAAMRQRLQGKTVQQFAFNPTTNDDGNRLIVQTGWFTAVDGKDYAMTTFISPLPTNHEDGSQPTKAAYAEEWFPGEDFPANFKGA